MTAGTYRYWPARKPVPDGWEIVSRFEGQHHGRHSILIRKVAA